MGTKLTKMDKFQMLADLDAVKASDVLSEFIAHEMELLTKKKSGSGKKAQEKAQADVALASALLSVMEKDVDYTVSRLVSLLSGKGVEVSASKVTSLLTRKVVGTGKVVRHVDKGVALYTKVVEDTSLTSLE